MRKSPASRVNRQRVAVASTARTLARAVIALVAVFGLFLLGGEDHAFSAEPDSQPVAAAPPGALEYVPGQVLVKFKASVGSAKRSQLEAGAGVSKALAKLGPEGRKDVRLLQLKAGTTVEQAVKKLRSSSDVVSVEPNYIRQTTA
ncbi:MAG: S8 family serine peptidase, partial [Thermoleophilia bacterium]